MRLTGFKRQAQRLAQPEQVHLADHLVRRLRTQLLGQRGISVNRVLGEQIAQYANAQISLSSLGHRGPRLIRPGNGKSRKTSAVALRFPRFIFLSKGAVDATSFFQVACRVMGLFLAVW